MTLQIGARLGRYRILSLLGRGGMADVYRAEDERLGREVALKALPPEFARDPERVVRFEREVRAAARLSHPNIVTVFEFGHGEGQHFYTMELMPGGDLKARIRGCPEGMAPAEARSVAVPVVRALDYAHRQGFVHRDVKPENILFDGEGTPQLTDFGIARAMAEGTRMTATGMSIGSLHYMSPEQARGLQVDGRSDLYSLGVVLYEMLTGRLPFDARDTLAVALAHLNDPVPDLPAALAGWQPVLDRLLAKSPADRYGSAAELSKVLSASAPPRASAVRPARVVAQDKEARLPRGAALGSLATRVLPVGHEVTPARRITGSGTGLAEASKPRRGLGTALVGAVLTLAVAGIGYLKVRDTESPQERLLPMAVESRVFDGIEFVWIPTGEFRMGSTSRHAGNDEKALTRVRISKGFWLGKYEVTQSQWETVMGSNPSGFKDCGGNCPIEQVSWHDVQEFVSKLNGGSGGRRYRLPTEAEWEYAARAGTTKDTYAGDIRKLFGNDPVLNRIAWYNKNSGNRTRPVGRKAPNAWGLHDMLGNVWEWVEDWYGDYPGGAVVDPNGPRSGSYRVLRGGGWDFIAGNCRSANRDRYSPGNRANDLGFRLLRE